MKEGLLWFDASPKRDLAEKVAQAADRYCIKFGRRPNLCYVHLSALDGQGDLRVDGVWVMPMRNVLRHHFWIGVEEEIAPRDSGSEPPPQDGVWKCRRCGAESELA